MGRSCPRGRRPPAAPPLRHQDRAPRRGRAPGGSGTTGRCRSRPAPRVSGSRALEGARRRRAQQVLVGPLGLAAVAEVAGGRGPGCSDCEERLRGPPRCPGLRCRPRRASGPGRARSTPPRRGRRDRRGPGCPRRSPARAGPEGGLAARSSRTITSASARVETGRRPMARSGRAVAVLVGVAVLRGDAAELPVPADQATGRTRRRRCRRSPWGRSVSSPTSST